MKAKHKRLILILVCLCSMSIGAIIMLNTLKDYLVFFYSPADIAATPPSQEQSIRVGGLVKDGSVVKDGQTIRFTLHDQTHDIAVEYSGILPTLFREGQGIIAEGSYQQNKVIAHTLLAKHDETYIPKEIADSLKEQGHWKGP